MQKRDLTKLDFAKRRTVFAEEFERKRALLVLELQRTVETQGVFSRLIQWAVKKPFIGN